MLFRSLKELNAVDFGDLLLEMNKLLADNPDILKEYHRRFKYILVDEYQDTNVAQYMWLRLIAQGTGNICCVGDDDQAIYGWRGAEVDNILRFEKDFPGAKTIRLERNYRATGHILAAASGLISHNEDRLGKTLHTEDGLGDQVIRSLALLLKQRFRSTDVIGRLGGEEFGVVLSGTGRDDAERIVNEVRETFAAMQFEAEDGRFSSSSSAGVSTYPEWEMVKSLCDAADQALYTAKDTGRNRVVINEP